ncbi:putative porin [Salinimicrobium flavum]|uniref:Porin n=1 Tax=Salinimicrobium flavum TaxID=1737065 RepID=A0ABW5IUY6_9FLAO
MKQIILFLFLIYLPIETFAQIRGSRNPNIDRDRDSKTTNQPEPAPISKYKIISIDNDTTSVDTSLTIYNEYRFNYLRRDRFELLPFPNVGQTYNRLAYNFSEEEQVMPHFGARAKHYNFMEAEDISYYHVPTPFTELYFKTVYEQGQTLDAFFTINTSENLNFSIAYRGLRSLGRYQHALVSNGNFRTTINYHTTNDRYRARAHFVSQDLMNEENGGLDPQSLENYVSKDPEFEDRSRLDMNFDNAQNTLYGKRFFLDHSYALLKSRDTLTSSRLAIGHRLNYSYKKFQFQQAAANPLFGPSFEQIQINDETRLESTYNEGFVEFANPSLGRLRVKGGFTHYNYGYNAVLDLESGLIPNRLVGDIISAGGSYATNIGGFRLDADGMLNVAGDFTGYDLKGRLVYNVANDIFGAFRAHFNESAPNYNFLLYQSDYINYNWRNTFSNENMQSFGFELGLLKLLNLEAEYTHKGNYTYFGLDEEESVKPMQHGGEVNYVKVTARNEIAFGKFALNNTVLYQKVLDGDGVLNVPDLLTRNTLYYSDHWFKRALYLQTGFTLKYFTNYNMDAYDPVLAEFYVQNEQEVEGFPAVDFFFNGKIRTARIFFKLERIETLLNGNNNFAAPLHPARDFAVRFGMLWNFFM